MVKMPSNDPSVTSVLLDALCTFLTKHFCSFRNKQGKLNFNSHAFYFLSFFFF